MIFYMFAIKRVNIALTYLRFRTDMIYDRWNLEYVVKVV